MLSTYDKYLANQSESQILMQNKKTFEIHAARYANNSKRYNPPEIKLKEDVEGWAFLDVETMFEWEMK